MSTEHPTGGGDRPRANRPLSDAPEPTPQDTQPRQDAPAPIIVAPRRTRLVETVLLASAAALLAAVAWPIATGSLQDDPAEPTATVAEIAPAAVNPAPAQDAATIQIALLLDTSSSMDGLIDQARSQLWQVVNALDSATFQDARPRLEIAVYEYGNDRIPGTEGFIRQVSPFSTELDLVSEALFGLTTSGGQELAGEVIGRSVDELKWRTGEGVLRVVYIAGNEEFDQGVTDYRSTIANAREHGIVVNTVNCLGHGTVPDTGWQEAAALGGGKFLSIDHNATAVYVAAPQDDEIAKLGQAINHTYVRYGSRGAEGLDNVAAQDNNSVSAGKASTVQRALSKGSAYYRNPGWDLVDGVAEGKIELGKLDRNTLSEDLQGLSNEELGEFVAKKHKEREGLQKRLSHLKREREAFVRAERSKAASDASTRLDDAIISSIVEQATAAGFSLSRS